MRTKRQGQDLFLQSQIICRDQATRAIWLNNCLADKNMRFDWLISSPSKALLDSQKGAVGRPGNRKHKIKLGRQKFLCKFSPFERKLYVE